MQEAEAREAESKLAKSVEEAGALASKMIGMQLVTPQTGPAGKKVNRVLVAQDVYYKGESDIREFYISILLDRTNEQIYNYVFSRWRNVD